jgi:hypothetical protein
MGADVRVHDPYVENWAEIEGVEDDPESSKGYARFFGRQNNLERRRIETDMWNAMDGVKCIIFAVPHKQYLELAPEEVAKAVGRTFAVIDCFCIFDDSTILRYLRLGCEVKGLGRGHIRRLKDSIR